MNAPEETAANLYPIALDLRGRRCVVVGGGAVASRKARALCEAGGDVCVVAPAIGDELRGLAGVVCIDAPFAPDHLDGAFLVVAATNDPGVNRAVADAARARGVLCNAAGASDSSRDDADAEGGDFVTMATVRRGDLLIALTTGGAGPALTARLRREFDARFGPEWGPYVALLQTMRRTAKAHIPDADRRTAALRRLAAADGVREALRTGDAATAQTEALACLS